jgi:UDP-2,3-diacylglucosamine hydrolase
LNKKTYFISDLHLGANARLTSQEREKQIVAWLNTIEATAEAIYFVGDIFEFWFDYQRVIPKGFVRFFGKIADLRDKNIPVYFFTGNHDMWMFGYFEEELGIPIYRQPIEQNIGGKNFFIGHGDGLGPGDHGYKMLKKLFTNRLCQWLFGLLHPDWGMALAYFWSGKSRDAKYLKRKDWLSADQEWLVSFCEATIKEQKNIDFFLFGHRHLPIDYTLSDKKTKYINIGDWLNFNSYGVFDGNTLEIAFFENTPVAYHY